MRVVVYSTPDETVPAKLRHVAHLIDGAEMFPLRFNAATPEAAQSDADAWLAAETERNAARIEARRKARIEREARAARKAAAQVIVEKAEEER